MMIGVLTFTDVTFDSLSARSGSCGIHGAWKTDASWRTAGSDATYVKLKNTTV